MKKRTLIIAIAAVLLVGAAVACFFIFGGNNNRHNTNAKPMDDMVAFYINVDQLVEKSAINNIITDANRSLIATVLASELDDPKGAEYIKSVMSDLSNTGINTKKPIYGYANTMETLIGLNFEVILVAEVADAAKIDRTLALAEEVTGMNMEVEHKGKMRTLPLGDDCIIGYNDSRFILSITSDNSAHKVSKKAFDRETPDLGAYAKYDIAYSANLIKVLDLACKSIESDIDEDMEYLMMCEYEYEKEWVAENITNMEQQLKTIKQFKDNFTDDSNAIMGLSFEKGRIVAEAIINGYNSEYELNKKVSNDYLKYVSKDAIAVMNMAVNGSMLSKMVSDFATTEYAELLGIGRGEFNIYMGILCDALKSINGDVTIALEDINGNLYYGTQSVDALLAIDADDDYIISNIAQFGEGLLEKRGKNSYGFEFDVFDFTIGQTDEALYLTVNSDFKQQSSPATKSAWYTDMKNSYGYLVLDIDNLMDNSLVASSYRSFMRQMDKSFAETTTSFIDSCSYAYINATTPNSAQMVLVFDDRNTNALEQITRQVVPAAIRTATNDMFR